MCAAISRARMSSYCLGTIKLMLGTWMLVVNAALYARKANVIQVQKHDMDLVPGFSTINQS